MPSSIAWQSCYDLALQCRTNGSSVPETAATLSFLSRRGRSRLGCRGEFFGEMALLTGRPRQADVVALSYCRLLVLRKADFDRFVTANPDAGAVLNRVAQARLAMNRDDHDRAAEVAS